MNDRFKFRAWYGGRFIYKNLCDACIYTEDDKCISLANMLPEDLKWEQCTGLKDKNGNLIYEGDIVKGSNGSINGQEWEFTNVVKWNEKLHRIVLPDFEPDENWSHYYNVIGNIHENPELLKEKQ